MKALVGICNNSVLTVRDILEQYQKDRKRKMKVQVLGLEETVRKKAHVILISTLHCFIRNHKALEKSDAVVIVFDTPMLLEYVKPIAILDLLEKKLSYIYSFKPLDFDSFAAHMDAALGQKTNIKVKREQFDVIPTMLGSQLSTILNPVQNYLYGVRDTDKRLQYQKHIYTWLVSGAAVATLEKGMMRLIGGDKKPVGLTRLVETLDQEGFLKMRKAFKEAFDSKVQTGAKKKAVNTKALAKRHGVDPFDIRYAMKALRKHGTFQVINRDVKDIYKEHVASSKARRATQGEGEV